MLATAHGIRVLQSVQHVLVIVRTARIMMLRRVVLCSDHRIARESHMGIRGQLYTLETREMRRALTWQLMVIGIRSGDRILVHLPDGFSVVVVVVLFHLRFALRLVGLLLSDLHAQIGGKYIWFRMARNAQSQHVP